MWKPRAWVPSVLLVLIVALCAGAGFSIAHRTKTSHATHTASSASSTPAAVLGATAAVSSSTSTLTPPTPSAAAVAAALSSGITDPALGPRVLASVVDASDSSVLYGRAAGNAAAPASTAKLLTAAAAIEALHADARVTTRVLAGARPGQIVLVGGGDPTLSAATGATKIPYPGAAKLADLAAEVKRSGAAVSSILVDDSRFTGPAVSPDWDPGDVPTDYASAITATMTDGGRAHPGDYIRSAQPDLAAGQALAGMLGGPGVAVAIGRAPARSRTLASVQSAPVLTLVNQMLQESDNVIAECLGRLVALAEHQSASFTGAVTGIRMVLQDLGVTEPSGMHDASGLAAADRLTPAVLATTVRLIVGSQHPELHGIVDGLPVAAWSGTLADRYVAGSDSASGAGVVRAKTGTLGGVSSLAGMVHDADGRLLVFAFIADQVESTFDAERALDDLAAVLARCGCR